MTSLEQLGKIQFPTVHHHVPRLAVTPTGPKQAATHSQDAAMLRTKVQLWTTCCGAKLKQTAEVIPLSEAKWPCRRAAFRKAMDHLALLPKTHPLV